MGIGIGALWKTLSKSLRAQGGYEVRQLTVLGGAGVRVPLLVNGLVARGSACPFDSLMLFDVDEDRLVLMAQLVQYYLDSKGSPLRLRYTTDIREALTGASFVFSALRVGNSESRVVDERVALRYGVVGQETTGPGGFAMALRTIPQVVQYASVMRDVAPDAWLLNFTNPAGIITEALIKYGRVKTIGICDSPEGIRKRLARFLRVQPDMVDLEYVGLNHLGWVTDVKVEGESRLTYLLDQYSELSRVDAEFAAFDADLVRTLGMLPNEYLYYYYYATDAVKNVESVGETRGEQVEHLTRALFEGLHDAVGSGNFQKAWELYVAVMGTRSQTYMQREMHATAEKRADRSTLSADDGDIGYAGVALRAAQSILGNPSGPVIVNTPNNSAISQLRRDDVVEVPACITADGPKPLAFGALPDKIEGLVLSVKQYERLTIQAAVSGDRKLALEALASHPLVPSYTVARKMLEDYLTELKEWLPQFS